MNVKFKRRTNKYSYLTLEFRKQIDFLTLRDFINSKTTNSSTVVAQEVAIEVQQRGNVHDWRETVELNVHLNK